MANTDNKINIGDTWKALDSIQINIGDAWKNVTEGYINIGDSWLTFWTTASGVAEGYYYEAVFMPDGSVGYFLPTMHYGITGKWEN